MIRGSFQKIVTEDSSRPPKRSSNPSASLISSHIHQFYRERRGGVFLGIFLLLVLYSILAITSLSSLFILFDFIVQDPHHTDTRSCLTLLDIASGHFSQPEHVSRGSLPGNNLSEFAHIARRYVQELPAPSAAGPSTQQPTTTLTVTHRDASLEVGTARDTVSAASDAHDLAVTFCALWLTFQQATHTFEMASNDADMDDLGNGTVFNASICFDDFSRTTDFLSDMDVRALLCSSSKN